VTERDGQPVLLRHGESVANAAELFTGNLDVPLTARGVRESVRGAQFITDSGIVIDWVVTSVLSRARTTAELAATTLAFDSARMRTIPIGHPLVYAFADGRHPVVRGGSRGTGRNVSGQNREDQKGEDGERDPSLR